MEISQVLLVRGVLSPFQNTFKNIFWYTKKKLYLGKHFKVDNVKGDGICLFQALSQKVY